MIEVFGDIWDTYTDYNAVVITTNGAVTNFGNAVMGRGIALAAKKRFEYLPSLLGDRLSKTGNLVYVFDLINNYYEFDRIITFPVKDHWRNMADIKLIKFSAIQLQTLSTALGLEKVIMPRPGCGNGGLKWEDVQPAISPILDDRFTVMENL